MLKIKRSLMVEVYSASDAWTRVVDWARLLHRQSECFMLANFSSLFSLLVASQSFHSMQHSSAFIRFNGMKCSSGACHMLEIQMKECRAAPPVRMRHTTAFRQKGSWRFYS